MRRFVVGWVLFAFVASLVLVFARLVAPGRFELELDIYILAVGGLALLEIVVVTREAYPRERTSALARALERDSEETPRPTEVARIERELSMATATAFDVHARLRPLVREIASARLARHGIPLEGGQDELGEEVWDLARPDRPPPSDRNAPGVEPAMIARVIERLESL